MKKLVLAIVFLGAASSLLAADDAKVGGNWQMTFESPHGTMQAAVRIQQDGSKLTGTYELAALGSLPLTGSVEGKQVSFSVELAQQKVTLAYTGTIEGDKMSGMMKPMNRPWTATRQ